MWAVTDAASTETASAEDRFWTELLSSLEAPRACDSPEAQTAVLGVGDALRRLETIERHYRAFVTSVPLVTFACEWSSRRHFRYVSPQIAALLGYEQGEWLADEGLWEARLHADDRERVLRAAREAFATSRALHIEYRLLARDGRPVHVREETGPAAAVDDGPRLAHGVLVDVSERREATAALERERSRAERYRARLQAAGASGAPSGVEPRGGEASAGSGSSDPLTGLASRPGLEELMAAAVERSRDRGHEVALLCVDIDSFRLVNDSLGLEAGDELLRQVADRLRALVGPDDALARPGADEFLFMRGAVPDGGGLHAAEDGARQVIDALAPSFEIAGSELAVTAAVGASVAPRDARDPEGLLRHADAAMHTARELGPGEFALYGGGTLEARLQLAETARLRRGIAAGELVLHYQPIIALGSGEVSHVEALVRWKREGGDGLVPPLAFVPLAEESGLIESLGRWVLDAMLEHAEDWIARGRDARISFNVSPRQLRRADFARSVIAAIEARSLDPARFCVEITESTAMSDAHAVEPLLRELREVGVRLALDDFGLGYSSLDRLRDLPFQMLKIDRSFLARAPADDGCTGIVRAVLELARALGMEAVAEGVETEEQRRFLLERECPLAQGFLLARPLPAEEVFPSCRPSRHRRDELGRLRATPSTRSRPSARPRCWPAARPR